MWLGCLFVLWAMFMAAVAFLFAVGLFIEVPWLLLVPAVLIGWRWVRKLQAGRRMA